MPDVYRIRCGNCSQVSDVGGKVGGYVTVDGRDDGLVLPDSYMAIKLDDGTLECLPHPDEDAVLKEHGFTWVSAEARGRLFIVEYKICAACGALHEEVQVSTFNIGCIVFLLVLAAALPVFRFAVDCSWGISLVTASMLALSAIIVVGQFQKIEQRKKGGARILRQCPSCGHDRLLTFSKARGKTLPCPFCKASAVTCTCAGIS
jgi:hypothetical protein